MRSCRLLIFWGAFYLFFGGLFPWLPPPPQLSQPPASYLAPLACFPNFFLYHYPYIIYLGPDGFFLGGGEYTSLSLQVKSTVRIRFSPRTQGHESTSIDREASGDVCRVLAGAGRPGGR